MEDPQKNTFSGLVGFTSIGGLILLWIVGAYLTADASILPYPWTVLEVMGKEARSGELLRHSLATLARVAAAFCIAMGLGTALGLLLGRFPKLDMWANPWVVVFLNVPALVVIVLCYLWIGLNEVAAIVAVSVNKTAMVLVTVREGAQNMNRAISEMAQVYRMTRWQRLRHIVLPQLAPFLSASARNGLAVIWKIVLVVEFLGRSNGIGFQIHLYFQLFDTAHVLAYAMTFVAVMGVIEYALLKPAETRALKWRRA
ncbi:Putative aliphatic sulfonates transport permease protein SsuC [Actibacterium lipolyticum]|uniref:Putative aliphatic sulfonates transport permease protein SsuC n=2 Tax=Actibacterium lipolyticum TaxID=1524263 RepID=A0A238JVG1_9RHOB|nr:Putative aliphatic sulfonates transport permease protein SsuC [Actibacterium lipolyticum]